MDAKQSSFSGVEFSVARLESRNGREGTEMLVEASQNEALKDFGDKSEIRDGTITGKVIRG